MKWLLLWLVLFSCSRSPLQDPEKAFRPAATPDLSDSYSLDSFRDALKKTLAAYKGPGQIPSEFHFAGRAIARDDYRLALTALEPELESWERFHNFMRANFDFYEVYGSDEGWGDIFSTGYYDVQMKGSKKPQGKFSEPIYSLPPDMVSVDLKAYSTAFPDLKPLQSLIQEQKSKSPSWRGRLVKEAGGTVPKILPYYQRSEIQRQRPLAGKNLELAYVDPIDAFYLEIQGSGIVELEKGKKLHVGYAAQNGFPYVAIGKFLTDKIPKEQITMQKIREHLNSLNREQQQDLFDKNPSFVFFQELKGESQTYSGAEVTAMRTIASDQLLFPKGTLAFLEIELPKFTDFAAQEPSAWERKPHWVFDQDTGGAIRGGGRIDQYMGMGPEAEAMAGVMKRHGKMWYVAPKAEFVERLRAGSR